MLNNISFTAINVHPYAFSELCELYLDDFTFVDEQQDFIYKDDLYGLAVVVQASNTEYNNFCYNAVSQSFVCALCDGDKVLAASKFSMKMQSWTCTETPRLRLFIDGLDLKCEHTYEVRITKNNSKNVLIKVPLRFFSPECLPNNSVSLIEAYLHDSLLVYRNINIYKHDFVDICFKLRNKSFDWNSMPEVLMTIYDVEGNSEVVECDVEQSCKPGEEDYFIVHSPLDFEAKYEGVVYAEIQMLGEKIGGIVFTTNDAEELGVYTGDELGYWSMYGPMDGLGVIEFRRKRKAEEEAAINNSLLESLVGLDDVKSKIRGYVDLVKFNNLRREASLPYVMPPLHAMFMGSPGTGKTTVAKIMGGLLKDAGVLSKGHVVVRERATLLGQNYNSESEKTLEALEEARGGILFIDEAYQLYQPNDAKDPGRFVIETLLTALADESNRDWMLILAGYTKPMERMFEMNPGFASRIPESNIYMFNDFSPEELMEIACRYFAANKYVLTDAAANAVKSLIEIDYANRQSNFGNGRHVMNIIQTGIIPAMARRIMSQDAGQSASVAGSAPCLAPSPQMLSTIEVVDIPTPCRNIAAARQHVGFASR